MQVLGIEQKYPSMFKRIVKIEDGKTGIDLVSKESGIPFTNRHFASNEYFDSAPENQVRCRQKYVGNLTYGELEIRTGADSPAYSCYYNHETFRLVTKIYQQDLKQYNYTFPYYLKT